MEAEVRKGSLASSCEAKENITGPTTASVAKISTTSSIEEEMMTPPSISVNTSKVFINTSFTVTLQVGSHWRFEHGLTTEDIWRSGLTADVVLESDNSLKANPCKRCSPTSRAVVELNLTGRNDFGPFTSPETPGIEKFYFDKCRSRCSSSRLHLGARVSISMKLKGYPHALISKPFELLSKKPLSMRLSSIRNSLNPMLSSSSSSTSPIVPESPPEEIHNNININTTTTNNNSNNNNGAMLLQQAAFEAEQQQVANIANAAFLIANQFKQQAQIQQSQPQSQQCHCPCCAVCGRPVIVTNSPTLQFSSI